VPPMRRFLVTVAESDAVREAEALAHSLDTDLLRVLNPKCVQRIIVLSECSCDMQSFVENLAAEGSLEFPHPVVVDIQTIQRPLLLPDAL